MKIAKIIGIALTLPISLGLNGRPAIASEYQLDPATEQLIIDRMCQMIVQGYTSRQVAEEVVYLMRLNLPAPVVIEHDPGIVSYSLSESMNELSLSMTRVVETLALERLFDKAECDF